MLFANRFNPLALKILPLSPMRSGFCGDLSRNFFVFKIDRGGGYPSFKFQSFQQNHETSFRVSSFKVSSKTPRASFRVSRLQRLRGKSQAVATTQVDLTLPASQSNSET
jgi:hypothetical protein